MSANRLLYLLIVIALLVVPACAPQVGATPRVSPASTSFPTSAQATAALTTLPFTHTACTQGVDLTGQTVSLYHILALVGEQNDTFLQPLKAGFDDAPNTSTHMVASAARRSRKFSQIQRDPARTSTPARSP